jgi:hypothetical protein
MEKDTVLLAVEKYNELRDFQKEVKSGKVFSFSRSWYSGGETNFFFTEDEVVKGFEAKNKELEAKNKELEAKIEKYGVKEPKEISINDLKKMSYWEFRKWRKS